MRRLIEELAELDKDATFEAIQALRMFYTLGTIPADLSGEAKLTVVGVIERGGRSGKQQKKLHNVS